MHARYLFLYHDRSIEDANAAFENWIHRRGDENNWWEPMFGVNSAGNSVLFASDYRNLDERSESLLDEYSTIDELWRFAWELTAHDAFYTNRIHFIQDDDSDGKSMREETKDRILQTITERPLDEIPQWFLCELLEAIKTDIHRLDHTDQDFSIQLYNVFKNTQTLRLLADSVSVTGNPPFASAGTPYDHRAFRLSGGTPNDPGSTILVADIHT